MRQVQLKTVKAREKQNVNVKAQTTYEDKNNTKTDSHQTNKLYNRASERVPDSSFNDTD